MTESAGVLNIELRNTEQAIIELNEQHVKILKLIEVAKESFSEKPEGLQLRVEINQLSNEVDQLDQSIQQREY